MLRGSVLYMACGLLACAHLGVAQQGAVEVAARASQFPSTWPAGPSRETLPPWAAPGAIRFARWDGGRIETAKAFLSGWPGFNPPSPDFVESMTNWYTPATVKLLEEAHINAIWVTFSNGFSIPSERAHMEQLKQYIQQCHRSGIRVFAYQSIANLFWEDMFEQVPESKDWVRMGADGKPTPYGAASYGKMGRVTRHMARISHPGWQEYLRRRVELAIDAGADGIFYDNNFNESLPETYQTIYRFAASRKRDVLLMGNFHEGSYVLNRLTNSLSTEDGLEPGLYAARNVGGRMEKHRAGLLAVGDKFLVNNVGLFRVHRALSSGWKPYMIEHGHREVGDRFSNPISARRHQVAIAEAAMCGGAFELFSEGAFADGLYRGRPEAMEIWRAIAQYHKFLSDNQALYVGAEPVATTAVVLDEASSGVPLLNGLAARNVLFDVIYEHDLTADRLRPYSAVAVLAAQKVRAGALETLGQFASRGGKLFVTATAASADEHGAPRPRPALFAKATHWESLPSVDEIAAALKRAAPPEVTTTAPAGVVGNVTRQPQRLLVHLLNYSETDQSGITVTVRAGCGEASLVSPDAERLTAPAIRRAGSSVVISIPRLHTYSVLVCSSPKL